jgi:hypothetical protein
MPDYSWITLFFLTPLIFRYHLPLKFWWHLPLFLLALSCSSLYIHNHIQIIFIQYIHPSPFAEASLSIFFFACRSEGKPPYGAEPRFELGPAEQQASALPTEPGCTLTEPRCTLTEPGCTLTEPRYTITEPGCTLTEPCYNITEPRCTLTEPRCTLT